MSDPGTDASLPNVKPLQLSGCYWWLFSSNDDPPCAHYFSSREDAAAAWDRISGGGRTWYVWQLVGVKGPEAGVPPAFDERVYSHLAANRKSAE